MHAMIKEGGKGEGWINLRDEFEVADITFDAMFLRAALPQPTAGGIACLAWNLRASELRTKCVSHPPPVEEE